MTKAESKTTRLKRMLDAYMFCIMLSWRASKPYTLIRLVCNAVNPFSIIMASFILKYILDTFSSNSPIDERFRTIVVLLLCGFGVTLLRLIAREVQSYVAEIHGEMVRREISMSILRKSASADVSMYDSAEYYDALNMARNDTYAVSSVLWNVLECAVSLVSFIVSAAILTGQDWRYAAVIACASLPLAFYGTKFTKLLYGNDIEQAENYRKQWCMFYIGSVREYAGDVRQHRLGGVLLQKYRIIWAAMIKSRKSILRSQAVFLCVCAILPEFLIVMLSIHAAYGVLSSVLTIGSYTLVVSLMGQVCGNAESLARNVSIVFQNALKVENMKKFEDLADKKIASGDKAIKAVETIEFKHVSFSYTESSKKVLDDVSFTIANKERVALVGKNGSGKSTIIKLLLRFYDVTEGAILINGLDIKEYKIDDLRECFGVYFQNSLNYPFSLRENIDPNCIGNSDIEMTRLLEQCVGQDIINSANNDLGVYIGKMYSDEGIELSQGQHQKLALTRTVFKNASALILDEPSSALDPEAEETIFRFLETYCKDKTTVFISHKLSNIYLADSVVFLEDGRVTEQGSKRDMLLEGGKFASLYAAQAARFSDRITETADEL